MTCQHGLCDGHGWIRGWALWTEERAPGGGGYVRKERITESEYNELVHKADWQKQRVYEGVKPCGCRPVVAPDDEQPVAGRRKR